MADGLSINIRGLQDVDSRLVLIGEVAGERVMRSVIFRSMRPVEEAAEANAREVQRTGAMAKATRRVYVGAGNRSAVSFGGQGSRFVVAVAPKVKDTTALALANLGSGRTKPVRGIFWGHLKEWGFTHWHSGKRVPGVHWLGRALASRAQQAIEIFRKLIGPAVDKAAKKQDPL